MSAPQCSGPDLPAIYQHPLAYLIGLEGVALMKAFAGDYDRAFTEARLAEVRALLDVGEAIGNGVVVQPMPTSAGYDGWAPYYDTPDNGLFALEEPVVRPMLDALPVGTVLDVGCGTGRHTAYLVERGHTVLGIDPSEGMLQVARSKVPAARFETADVPVFAEVARVLRPGGRFVVSDTCGHYLGSRLYPLVEEDPAGNVGYLSGWRHSTVAYLQAALAAGFRVLEVHEPGRPAPTDGAEEPPPPARVENPDLPPNIWELHAWAPEAANAAKRDDPGLIIWGFELEAPR
jgi:SAM-dependent methyltransferase